MIFLEVLPPVMPGGIFSKLPKASILLSAYRKPLLSQIDLGRVQCTGLELAPSSPLTLSFLFKFTLLFIVYETLDPVYLFGEWS